MVTISVIIPSYNASATIQKALDSVLAQTLPPVEIIVVDDCSTDNTIDVLKQYKSVIVIKHVTNKGPSASRNTGWDAASGDVIAFLDSDDTWHRNKLQVISDIFSKTGDLTYLGHNYTLTDENSTSKNTPTPYTISQTSILLKNPYQPSCLTIKRELPLRFNGSYRYCEDHELSVRVAKEYKCHFIDSALTQLGRPQLSAGGASGNLWKMRKGELKIYSSAFSYNILFTPLIPFLWIYSLLKMCKKLIGF